MSYMTDRDHIAITSRDTSTTRCKVSVTGMPSCSRILSRTVSIAALMVVSRSSRKYHPGSTVRAESHAANACRDSDVTSSRARGADTVCGAAGRPPGTVGLAERRDRYVDAEIRAVSHNCRIVTYQNGPRAVLG